MKSDLVQQIKAGSLEGVRAAVRDDPAGARKAQPVVEAGRVAFLGALKILKKHGADLNVSWRGYRALHALIQERAHGCGKEAERRQMECLEWLLESGSDPELTGGWPASRALICAAFAGRREYVPALQAVVEKKDGFSAAALGDARFVRRCVEKSNDFTQSRDVGGLTALQCAAGSRVAGKAGVKIAAYLIDRGAEVNLKTRSWSHEVGAVYLAANAQNFAVFELLLDRGGDATEGLVAALWNATDEFAEAAMARGAKPDEAISDRRPLLNDLIRWGRFKQAYWLLKRGANPNVADSEGRTAVDQAVSRGNRNMLQALLEAGGILKN